MTDQIYEGDRIFFRPIGPVDEPLLRMWRNDPAVWATLGRCLPMNESRLPAWIKGLYSDGGPIAFLICRRQASEPIGFAVLSDVQPIHRSAELGIAIGEQRWQGLGYGKEAIGLLLQFAFERLGLHRVESRASAGNARLVRTLSRAGLVQEGRRRGACYRGGEYVDELHYAMLKSDWCARGDERSADVA